MLNKNLLVSLFLISMLLLFSAVTLADLTEPTPTTEPSTDPTVTTPVNPTAKDQQMADAIAESCQIPVTAQEVADMHASGYGYGEISKAYGLASLSGKAVSEIAALRAQDIGWGEIAKSLGFKISDVTGKQKTINSTMKNQTKTNNGKKDDSSSGKKGKGKKK